MRLRLSRSGGPGPGAAPSARCRPPDRTVGGLLDLREEGARQRGAPARLLVLEVDVDTLPARGVADPRRPGLDGGVVIVATPQAEVAEGRGRNRGCRERLGIGDAERGAVAR